jgi:hypothetical protein
MYEKQERERTPVLEKLALPSLSALQDGWRSQWLGQGGGGQKAGQARQSGNYSHNIKIFANDFLYLHKRWASMARDTVPQKPPQSSMLCLVITIGFQII